MRNPYRHIPLIKSAAVSLSLTRTGGWYLLVFLVCLFTAGTRESTAQSVHPDVYLEQSTATTSTRLDQLRASEMPQIGLFYSRRTMALNAALEPVVEEAIRQWELFLVGLELPYEVLEDSSLSKPVDEDIKLLIMPSAEVLSEAQRASVRAFMQRGGGLIASGRVGFLDDRGVLQNDRFFRELFKAEPSIDLPDSLGGLIQTIAGGLSPTDGIPPGYKLNINRPVLGTAVLPIQSNAMGHLEPYQNMQVRLIQQALEVSTLLLEGSYGAGRFVWMGFNPQDVSQDYDQQMVYQGLVLNAMAHVVRAPILSIRRWPHGFSSASGFAILPSLGYQPYAYRLGMDLVLDALDQAKISATYFVVAEQAHDHPDILERIAAQGEIALTSDTDAMLAKQPLEMQRSRVLSAREQLGAYADPATGFYPPGGFYDPNTLRVLMEVELDYMLSDARQINVPAFLDWEEELDYRDVLLELAAGEAQTLEPAGSDSAGSDSAGSASAAGARTFEAQPHLKAREIVTFHPSLFSYTLDDRSGLNGQVAIRDTWKMALEKNFRRLHNTEGLFLFAFEPEIMGLTQQRAQILEAFGRYVRTQNTWIATLGEMTEWWIGRHHVRATVDSIEANGYTILVHNESDEVLRGVSLDFALDFNAHKLLELETGALDVWSKREPENMLIVIEALPPGSHRIRLVDPTITASAPGGPGDL